MGKHPKNRKTKTFLAFDESARHDYLTGFKKRKDERRKKAQLEIAARIKGEQKEMKKKHMAMLKKAQTRMQKEAADIESLMETNTYTTTDHTVTVTHLGESRQTKYHLGNNNKISVAKSSETNEQSAEAGTDERILKKTHKLTKKNKIVAKPSFKKSKHKSYTHGLKKGRGKKQKQTLRHVR